MQILNRNEMKMIKGGVLGGHACHYYCCDSNNNCSEVGVVAEDLSGTTNEECQESGQGEFVCSSGSYLAALYKRAAVSEIN